MALNLSSAYRNKGAVLLVTLLLVAVTALGAAVGYNLQSGDVPAQMTPEARQETALAAADADESAGQIELVDLNNRDLDGSPALALTFSQALDARQSYDELIQVFELPLRDKDKKNRARNYYDEDDSSTVNSTAASIAAEDVESTGGTLVSGAWIVGENPRLLFFPHIKPEARYVVRVAAGVPARNGEKTSAESRYGIVTAAVSPAFYFASKGTVLPARQNGGLPVVTVNVPEVDIQFLKVKPDQISKFLDRVIGGNTYANNDEEEDAYYYYQNNSLNGAMNNWELDNYHGMTESVYAGRFLTEQKANRRSVTFIPVEDIKELSDPGIYIAVMNQPNRFRYDYQVTYFYTSNLGLHTRLFEKDADAYVSSLDKGTAVRDVDISWLDAQGKILLQGKTDGEGRAHFAERPKDAKVVMAQRDKEVALIALKEPALDLSEYDIGGAPGRAISLFAYSGRNLYRPGERFDISVLARDADGHPVPAQPVQAILKAPDGKAQFTAAWNPESVFSGYYQRALEIPDDAATGFWNLELRADPADKRPTTVYRFGVEEFLPERMKLDLKSANPQLDATHPFDLQVEGNYLYGAPAAGNRLLGVAQFLREKNPLAKQLPGFEFGDANEDSARHREELEETALDDAGKASLEIDLEKVAGRQSPFLVRATMSLLENGGRPVIRTLERVYWPAPQLLAVRPLFTGAYAREGSIAQFEVVRVDAEGKFSGGTYPVRLFRENRDYYWRFEDQRGWHSGYTETDELIRSSSITLTPGTRGTVAVPVKYGRYRLEINDPETGKRLAYRFYAGWNAQSDESQGIRPDRVNLKLDKPAYKEGETAHLTITPPHAGEALITVEADNTLWVKRLSVPAEGKVVDIPVQKEWLRHDLYVSVLALRPGSEGAQVTPARALGLVYLPLERGERKLGVKLEAPQKVPPETPLKVKIKVPDAKGQKAQVTLSAVDVGILNITNFRSPDPFNHFFGKLRYGADQHDVYGRLIEKMAGQKGKLKFGGDAMPEATKSLPKKVRLVDLFSGPVALNAQGEAEITLPVPDFNGQLRLMAVVAAPDKFGSAESDVTVAAPLVAELSTPRFLTVGDAATVALDLHNLSGAAQTFQVELANEGGLKIREAKRKLTLKDQQKVTLRFPVEAGRAFGLVPVSVKVSGGVSLNREFALQVQSATPRQQILRRYALAPGESVDLRDANLSGLLPASTIAHVTVSDTPPLDVRSAIQGLLRYPYGCTEQTTSTAYPHVFIGDEEARAFGLKAFSRAERAEMLEKAIARLGATQAPNGGFSLWGNASEYEYWLSAYVSNFLLDAREQGFSVPEHMHNKALDFLLKGLQEGAAGLPKGKLVYDENAIWRDYHYAGSGRFSALAYGAYVLARESRAPLSTLRNMFDLREQAPSSISLVHLGLALSLMGDEKRGQIALEESMGKARLNRYWWGDYGSDLRDAALSYTLLERHKKTVRGKENLIPLIASELENRHKDYYYASTQEQLALFLVGRQMSKKIDGKAWKLDLAGKPLSSKGSQVQNLSVSELGGSLKASNTGSEKLYLELALEGHASHMPATRSQDIGLKRKLFDAEGKPLGNRSLKVGESVLVMLEVTPRVSIKNALVVDRIPAGLEIENLNIVQSEGLDTLEIEGSNPAQAMTRSDIQHVEYRDDRFAVALRLNTGYYDRGVARLFYRARVVTPGKFVFPPLYAEDMYRPNLYGLAEGEGTVTVTDAKAK